MWDGGVSSSHVLYRDKNIMIILRKEKHYQNAFSREDAQKLVDDGFEIVSNKIGGSKIVKSEPKKKKLFKKK